MDPAADWERLAAGAQAAARAQAAGAQAARWRAQTDAEVANEWPGPPLRTAVRNGLLAGVTAPRPAGDQYATMPRPTPGLTRPRQAAEEPGLAAASVPARPAPPRPRPHRPGSAAPAEATESGQCRPGRPARPAEPDQAGARSRRPGRARRARSRRAAADLPAEPDAADEWISLLTADPVEE